MCHRTNMSLWTPGPSWSPNREIYGKLLGGWTNPSETICSSKMVSPSPIFGVKVQKNIWNHHLVFFCVKKWNGWHLVPRWWFRLRFVGPDLGQKFPSKWVTKILKFVGLGLAQLGAGYLVEPHPTSKNIGTNYFGWSSQIWLQIFWKSTAYKSWSMSMYCGAGYPTTCPRKAQGSSTISHVKSWFIIQLIANHFKVEGHQVPGKYQNC